MAFNWQTSCSYWNMEGWGGGGGGEEGGAVRAFSSAAPSWLRRKKLLCRTTCCVDPVFLRNPWRNECAEKRRETRQDVDLCAAENIRLRPDSGLHVQMFHCGSHVELMSVETSLGHRARVVVKVAEHVCPGAALKNCPEELLQATLCCCYLTVEQGNVLFALLVFTHAKHPVKLCVAY